MSRHQRNRPDFPPLSPLESSSLVGSDGRPLERGSAGSRQATTEIDPDLENHLRAPYDPFYDAQVTRFTQGAVLRNPPQHGWMRVAAFFVALSLLGGTILGLSLIAGAIAAGVDQEALGEGARVLLISGPLGATGAVLLWRLVRRRPGREAR